MSDTVSLVFFGQTTDGQDIWVWSDGSVTGDVHFVKTMFRREDVRREKEADD